MTTRPMRQNEALDALFSNADLKAPVVIALTLKQYLHNRVILVSTVVMSGILILIPFLFEFSPLSAAEAADFYINGAALFIVSSRLVTILVMMYVMPLVHEEIKGDTMQFLLTRPMHRLEFILYRFTAFTIFTVMALGVPMLVFYTLINGIFAEDPISALLGNFELVFFTLLLVLVSAIAWGSVFLFMSIFFKHPVPWAIGLFVFDAFFDAFAALSFLSVTTHLTDLARWMFLGETAYAALLIILVMAGGMLFGSIYALAHKELQ